MKVILEEGEEGDRMRIMGFAEKWDKLLQPEFITFRVPRKDRDWWVGEQVKVVYKPRSKYRESLGIAEIISKEAKTFTDVAESEAIADGFDNCFVMWEWLCKSHKGIRMGEPLNKFTLRWLVLVPHSS